MISIRFRAYKLRVYNKGLILSLDNEDIVWEFMLNMIAGIIFAIAIYDIR